MVISLSWRRNGCALVAHEAQPVAHQDVAGEDEEQHQRLEDAGRGVRDLDRRLRHLPVVENGKLIGLLSIGDLVKEAIAEQAELIRQLEQYIRGE